MGVRGKKYAVLFPARPFRLRIFVETDIAEHLPRRCFIINNRFFGFFEIADALPPFQIERILRIPRRKNSGTVLVEILGIHTADLRKSDDFRDQDVVIVIFCHRISPLRPKPEKELFRAPGIFQHHGAEGKT